MAFKKEYFGNIFVDSVMNLPLYRVILNKKIPNHMRGIKLVDGGYNKKLGML